MAFQQVNNKIVGAPKRRKAKEQSILLVASVLCGVVCPLNLVPDTGLSLIERTPRGKS